MTETLRRYKVVLENGRKCSNRFISGANRSYCSVHSGSKKARDQKKSQKYKNYKKIRLRFRLN